MTSLSFNAALDFNALDGATIELTPEQIWQAGVEKKKGWTEYLETLALDCTPLQSVMDWSIYCIGLCLSVRNV